MCNHKFQGDKNGVKCLLCGIRLTTKEYLVYIHPKKTGKKKEDKAVE